jgi:hypothetical protein
MATFKMVLNTCFGGYCLSDEAKQLRAAGVSLVEVVERLGTDRASARGSNLEIAEFPIRVKDLIMPKEYDGKEWVEFDTEKWVRQQLDTLSADNWQQFRTEALDLFRIVNEQRDINPFCDPQN